MKKVSVIIPTYKRANYLKRAIDSVLNQTYKNIEIIVVDDNDQDSEYRKQNIELMSCYKNYKNIFYLKHKINKNGSAARNTGIKKSTGDYITFLDDDDFYLKDRIELLVKTLEENDNYDCAYTSMITISNKKIVNYKAANKSGNFLNETLKCNSIFGTGSNLFFRRKAVQEIGLFDERFLRSQDIEYMVRFFLNFSIIGVDDILVVKCNDDRQNVKSLETMEKVKKMYFRTFKDIIDKSLIKDEIYYKNYEILLYFSSDNIEKFKEYKKEMQKYGKYSINTRLKVFYKKYLQNNSIYQFIINLILSIKYKRKLSLLKKQEIEFLLNEI